MSGENRDLEERLHQLVPGGAHTFAKGADQWPEGLAPVLVSGRGCRVQDVEGREYIEYGAGLRSITLGHANPEVNAAIAAALDRGLNFVRPTIDEINAAEAFLEVVPGNDMVKFCKNGSDATTAAVRLARAATHRTKIAICSDHPFFSTDNWFIGTTPINAGIPEEVSKLTVGFPYGDIDALERVISGSDIACVVMEAERTDPPPPGYLQAVRDRCSVTGTVLVFDEMITGFRWPDISAQVHHGVTPDLSTFGKALGNGYPISALTGRRDLMELGGLRHDRERVFLLSTTHGAETAGLAAVQKVIEIYQRDDVVTTLSNIGQELRDGIASLASERGIETSFGTMGRNECLLYFTRDRQGEHSAELRTLFLQETAKGGLLAPSLVASTAHQDAIDQTLEIIAGALDVYVKALDDGVDNYLVGEPVKSAYRSRN